MENCYQPDPVSGAERLCREFEPHAFDLWLERLSDQGLCPILIALILKLERLARAPVDGVRLQTVMRRLVAVARDVADDLPRVVRSAAVGQAPGLPLSLEQRLNCLTFKNLKRTLELLDRSGGGGISQRDAARAWVLWEMFNCLSRQIELGALWGRPWPPQTWQELHDLYAYCRGRLGVPDRVDRPESDGGFDAEAAYKRLLLMGLIADQRATALLAPEQTGRFAAWVDETNLQDPSSYFGVLGAFLVECSRDIPPRRVPGALGSVTRAWVLEPPSELVAELAAIKTERDRRDFAVE